MASVAESECHKDPNFAVICSFLDKYGEILGLPQVSYSELEAYLEDTTGTVSKVLVDIHVRLLRRIGRSSVQSDRFEKSIIKFCHHFSEFDAWEVESYGYKHANLKTKLRILKNLLECQFDFNLKFKEKVNESNAASMRFLPIGRDKEGQAYWYFLDKDFNLLVYKEEQDDEDADTWQLVCSDRQQLSDLVNILQHSGSTDVKEEEDKTSTESQSSKEGSPAPARDDGSLKDEHKVPVVSGEKEDSAISKQEADVIVKGEPVERDKDKMKVECTDDVKAENAAMSMLGSKKIKIELDAKEVEKTLGSRMPNGNESNKKLNSNEKETKVQSTDASSLSMKSSDSTGSPHTNETAVPPDVGTEEGRLKKNKENVSDRFCDNEEELENDSSLSVEVGIADFSVTEVETKKSVESGKCDVNISSENKDGAVEASRMKTSISDCSTAKCTEQNEKENVKDLKGCEETVSDVNKDKNDTDLSKGGPDTTEERSGHNKTSKKDVSSSVPLKKVSDDVDSAKITDANCPLSTGATETNKIIKDPDKITPGMSEKSSVTPSDAQDKGNSESLGEANVDKQVMSSHSNVYAADDNEMDNEDDFEDDDIGLEPSLEDHVNLTPSADAEKEDVENADKQTQESDTASTTRVNEKSLGGDSSRKQNSVEETMDTGHKSDNNTVTDQVNVTEKAGGDGAVQVIEKSSAIVSDDATHRSDVESQNVQLKNDPGCDEKAVVESKDLKGGSVVQAESCVKVGDNENNEAGEKANEKKDIGREKTSETKSEDGETKLSDEQKPKKDQDQQQKKCEVLKHNEHKRNNVKEDAETMASLDKGDGETRKLNRESDIHMTSENDVGLDAVVENDKESDCRDGERENKVEGPVKKDGDVTSKGEQGSGDVDSKSQTDGTTTDVSNKQTECSAKVSSTSLTSENTKDAMGRERSSVGHGQENSFSKDKENSISKSKIEKSVSAEPEEKGETGKSESKGEAGKSESKGEAGKSESKVEAGKSESKVEAGKSDSKDEAGKSESKGETGKSDSKDEAGKSESNGETGKSESKGDTGKSESKEDAGKSDFKDQAGKSESKGETGKSESKGETGKSESKGETGKSESKGDTGKSESKGEAGKSDSKDEAGKPDSKDEAGKSESKEEAGKSDSKDEAGKSNSKDEAVKFIDKTGKSESKEEAGKSESQVEAGKSEQKDEAGKSKSKVKDSEAGHKTGKSESKGQVDEHQAEDVVEKFVSKSEGKKSGSKDSEACVTGDGMDQTELKDKAENVRTENKGDERSAAEDEPDQLRVSKGEVEKSDTTDKKGKADTKGKSEKSDTTDKAKRSDPEDETEKSDSKDKAKKSDTKAKAKKSDKKDKTEKSDSKDNAENSEANDKVEKSGSKDETEKSNAADKAEKSDIKDKEEISDTKGKAETSEGDKEADSSESKGKADKSEAEEKSETTAVVKTDEGSTTSKNKKVIDNDKDANENKEEKNVRSRKRKDRGKDTGNNDEEEPKNDVSKKTVVGSEGHRKLKRGAPEPESDDTKDSEPNGKRARQIAKVQKTRGGRNAAARGLAARVPRKDSESDDSEPVSQPVVAARGRGKGRGRRGRGGRDGVVKTGGAAVSNKKTSEQEGEDGEEEVSDQTNAKRALKKKPDSSSEALSEEEVTPAKKGRSQIQNNGSAIKVTSATRGRGQRGGKAGGTPVGQSSVNKKKPATASVTEADEPSCRRSARVKELRSRRPPTPDTPEEESEATEVEEEGDGDEVRFKDNDYLHDSFSPEEESGDEEFLPKGRNFQRQAARTIKEGNEEVPNDDTPCVKCGKYNHPEMILLCDKCDAGYHTACLRPPLMVIPDGDWFCPPCEHCMLVDKLMACLQTLDTALKKKNRLFKRQERLAYVGISINNILYKDRPVAVSEKYSQNTLAEDVKIEANGTKEEEEEQKNGSGSSTYESEQEEPQHKFRSERLAMRQAQKRSRQIKHKRKKASRAQSSDNEIFAKRTCRTRGAVSYQFKEFDELISNAIDDDQPVRKERPPATASNIDKTTYKPKGRSRGKDMSNILGASDEEDEKIRQRDGSEVPMPVVKRKPRRRLTMLESDEEGNSEDESEEFKLSEEDSEATEVEGSDDDDQDVEEDELNSGSSDSGDWKPKKTWFNKRTVSGGRRRNRFVDDDEEEYDSDENASKRRSTRNSRKGRVNYDDFESELETEEETEEEEEASFSDLSSEDSQFARKMKKEKEKRQKKAEASANSSKKGKKKTGVDEEETEESVSDSSISRKRKILSEQVNKRRKDGTDSDEAGGVSQGKKKKKGGRIKIKVKKPKKKKEYSDDDTVTSSEEEASSDETWAPKSRKKRVIRSCDELSEEEKLVEEKSDKEKTSSVVEESQDAEKDVTEKVVTEKDDAVVGDIIADKETPTDIPPQAVTVNKQAVVLLKDTLPASVEQQVDENITSPPASKRRGRRTGAGTNQAVSKGKKRGEITAMDNAGRDVNDDAKDEPVPGKMRRVSGECGDEMVENKSQDAAAPPGYGDIFNTPDKKAPVAGQRRGSAEKVKRAGKKSKFPNFLDVPSGGEESEENELTSPATNMKKEASEVLPTNPPMSSPSSAPQESLPVPASEGTAPPRFPGAQNMPQMYNQPYPGPQFQRGPHPYPSMYMQGGPRPSPPHQPSYQRPEISPNPQNMGISGGPSVTQGPHNYSGGHPIPLTTCGPPPASVESSASVRGSHPYPSGYNTGVSTPMGQGLASHQNLEPGQIPPGMSMSRPMNPSYPMGSHDPRHLPPHQQQQPPHHSHSQPWGDMRGPMPPGDPNAHFPHYRGGGPPPLRKTFPQHPYYNIRPPPGMGQYMPGMRPPHPTQPMMNNPLTSMGQMARNLSPTSSASSPPPTKNTGESNDDGKASTGPAPIGSPPRQDVPGSHVKVEAEDKSSEMRGKDAQTSGTEKPVKPGKKQKVRVKSEKGSGSGQEGEKEVGQKQSDSQAGQPPIVMGDQTDSIQHPQAHYPQHPYAAGPHQGHQYMPHHYRMPYMGGPMAQGMPHPPGGYPYGGPPPPTTSQHHHGPQPPQSQQGAIVAQSPSSGPTTQPQTPVVPHPQRGRPPLHQTTNMTSAQMHAQQHPPLPPTSSSPTASPSTTTGQYYHMSSIFNPGSLTTNQHRGPGRPPKYLSKPPPQSQQQQPELGQQQQQQGNFHHLEKQSSLESKPSTVDKPTDTIIKKESKADSTHPSSQASDASVPPASSSSSTGGAAAIPTQPNPSVPYQQASSDGALPPNMSPNRHSHGGPPISSLANFPPHAAPGTPYYSGGQYYSHPPPYGHIPPSGHHPHPQHPPPGMPHPPHTNWGHPMGPYDPRFRPPMPHHGYPPYPMNSDSSTTTTNIPPPTSVAQQQPNTIPPHTTPPHAGVAHTPPHTMAGPQQDFHAAPSSDKPALIGDRRRSSSTDSKPSTTINNDNPDVTLVKKEPQKQLEDSNVEKNETTEPKGDTSLSLSSSSSVTVTTVTSSSTSSTISTAAIKEERRSSATSPPTSTPSTSTTTTTSTPPPPPQSSSPSSSPAVAPSTPTSSIPPSQPTGQMRGPVPNTTWSGPNMGPQYHPMSQIGPYNAMPPYGHPPGMMGPHGPYMMGHGDNPGHQGPHMNQGHYFPPPPGQYPVPPHMNRGYNYCPPYMNPGMDPMTPPGQGFAAEMQGLPPPPQLSKDCSIPRSNGEGAPQQQLPPHHQVDPHGGESGGTSSAPKAKRVKTQKKKEGGGGGSPNAPRGKAVRGGRGRGGGRGGFMIDSLLQSRGAGGDGSSSREEGGDGEEGAADMKDIMSYVVNDEYFKQQTSS